MKDSDIKELLKTLRRCEKQREEDRRATKEANNLIEKVVSAAKLVGAFEFHSGMELNLEEQQHKLDICIKELKDYIGIE